MGFDRATTNLTGDGVVTFYHAGIRSAGERERRHDRWTDGDVRVIVATVAFGMGPSFIADRLCRSSTEMQVCGGR